MPLWNHQKHVTTEALKHTGYMIAHSMGCGKSLSAIEIANRIDAKNILILCPKTVISVWPEQFKKHSQKTYTVLPLEKGSVKKKTAEAEKLLKSISRNGDSGVVVLNYESAWRPPAGPDYNDENKMIDKGLLINTKWDLIILDESHRIKAPGSKISWFAKRLAASTNKRLCLTGTPTPNSPLDIYAQYRFLDSTVFGTSYARFRNHYATMGGFENRQAIGYINEKEMNKKFYSIAHKVSSRDVLDLPPEMHETRYCNLSPKAQKIYKTIEKDFYIKVDKGELTVNNALVKLLRLSQITGGYMPFDDQEKGEIIDNAKLDVLEDLLTDIDSNEPVTIFSRFTNEIERIVKLCEKLKRKPSVLYKGINEIAEWQAGYSNVLIAQVQSGSEGISLVRSNICILFSVGFSLGQYEQLLARTMRPGQKRNVVYYSIIAKGTVNEKVYAALRNKKKVIDYIFENR